MVLVPEIAVFALMFFTLALALMSKQIAEALRSALSQVPVIGSVIASIVSPIPHALSWAAGKIEHGIDALAGATWHSLAAITRQFWDDLVHTAQIVAHLAAVVGNFAYSQSGLKAIVHALQRAYRGIEHGVRDLLKRWHGIEQHVKALEHAIAKGIGHDLRLHIKALEHTLHKVRTQTIPAIQDEVATAEAEIGHLYDWAKGKASLLGVGTFAFAVATALGALGLDWIKCKEGKNLYNQRGCAMWSDLGQLLGIAFIAAEIANLDELIKVAQTVTEDVVKGVETLLDV